VGGLNGRYAIAGIGESRVGRRPDATSLGLAVEAAGNAVADAGLSWDGIDGVLSHPPYGDPEFLYTIKLAETLGLKPSFALDLHLGGATPCAAAAVAAAAIDAGLCHTVLYVFAETMLSQLKESRPTHGKLRWGYEDFEEPFGLVEAPAAYALGARRHMHDYGTKHEQLGAVAVTTRQHASMNENAQVRKPMTLDDYLASRWIAEPFRMLDCSLISDFGGAFIVTPRERAQDLNSHPVPILGAAQHHPHRFVASFELTRCGAAVAGPRAFEMAGLSPQDIDVAELYDSFTYTTLLQLEDYGFCKKGEGGAFVEGGRIAIGGELPVNTHGGLLSQAHADGTLHVTEAVRQLRGSCGQRQVDDAKVALVSGSGGIFATHSTLILGRG
jgi:acetyl-CoA acetyltransferase